MTVYKVDAVFFPSNSYDIGVCIKLLATGDRSPGPSSTRSTFTNEATTGASNTPRVRTELVRKLLCSLSVA